MQLYLRLAWRNIWRHRRRTLIVVLAIGLTLGMMMFYDGFVGGFEQAIYGNAIRVLGGNIQIHAPGYNAEAGQAPMLPLADAPAVVAAAQAQPEVLSASQRILTGGLASSAEGAFSVSIIGIQPEAEQAVSLPAQNVSAGRFLTQDDGDVVFLGKGLADAMGVTIGDRITLVGRATHEQMRQRTMTVIGIFDLRMPEIEKRSVYISLAEAQDLYGLTGQATEVAVTLRRLGQEKAVMAAMQPGLTDYEIVPWQTSFPEFEATLQTKGGVMDVFSVIILMIAGIGTLNLLLMAVYERRREIGLLGALGMKPGQISFLFLLEGAFIGLVGVIVGVGMGLTFNLLFGQVGMDYSKFTGMTEYTALINSRIYPTMGVEKLAQRVSTALIISLLASYYPAREAALKEPAQALHTV